MCAIRYGRVHQKKKKSGDLISPIQVTYKNRVIGFLLRVR